MLKEGLEINLPQLNFVVDSISQPDVELVISASILNEILNQNFPLETSVAITSGKQVEISVAGVEIHLNPKSEVELRVTNAHIQYDQTIFKIGLHSNVVAVRLLLGVIHDQTGLRLVGQGRFSEFHIKYLPKWVEARLAEVLTTKFLSPLVDIRVDEFLALEKELETDFINLRLALKPAEAAIMVDEAGVKLQVKFDKLVQ